MTMKFTIKKEYEKLRIERTKSHLQGLQVPVMSMVRPPPPPKILMTSGTMCVLVNGSKSTIATVLAFARMEA